jgi:uncharacterized protein YycO
MGVRGITAHEMTRHPTEKHRSRTCPFRFNVKPRISNFGVVLMMVGSGIGIFLAMPNSAFNQQSAAGIIHSVSREVLHGHLNGHFQGNAAPVQESVLEPGDILLCHNRGGGYGFWTHAVVYVGGGSVVDSNNFTDGTTLFPISNYQNYDTVAVLRATTSPETRAYVAKLALEQVGKPYNPFAGLNDPRSEYCSKLIWQVYRQSGIELCPPKAWIFPDDIANSSALTTVRVWGADIPKRTSQGG